MEIHRTYDNKIQIIFIRLSVPLYFTRFAYMNFSFDLFYKYKYIKTYSFVD